ncbi:hypothetical protein, partial [Wenzhouxiangella sediminis]|uniref:hypothetical protein n=1 Tax=Wenzhouxiangella sediminis TaxID=1792836 RepID=UPI001C6DFD5D
SGFRFQVSGFRFQVSGFRVQGSGKTKGFRVPGSGPQDSIGAFQPPRMHGAQLVGNDPEASPNAPET